MIPLDLLAFDIRNAFEGEKFQTALGWLPQEEHGSVLRFKHYRDQHLALASRLLRRHYFSRRLKVPWSSLFFEQMPLGKPILRNEKIDYNISHQGNWVIFGAAMNKDMKIGIDAVTIDRPNSSIDDFVKCFLPQLTKNEIELIMSSQNDDIKLATFYELWGCKESYIKALGVGLSLDVSKLDFRNENDQIKMNFEGKSLDSWFFHMSYLDEETLTVVCFGEEELGRKGDAELLSFASTTKLLGQKPLHIMTNGIFNQLKYRDIENDRF